jgi:membrane peptidoglycan carboxypeptidase
VTGDGEKAWIPIDGMGYLPAAVIAAEDQRFRQHVGYDETEVAALFAHITDGQPARGASTITQQLARTLVTGHERTAARKLRELLYAIEMERTLGKERILALYLNTVDWGPGICGAKAAARAYFNKPPGKLTPIEAAWLAGILRNPREAHASQLVPASPQRERAQWIVAQMRDFPRADRARWAKAPLALTPPKPRQKPPAGGVLPPLASTDPPATRR